jgi:hypothetical protein
MKPAPGIAGLLAGLAFVLFSAAASAQEDMLDGGDVDTVLAVARSFGSAILESQRNGDPKIAGQIDQIRYALYFLNCTDHRECRHLNFYSGFADAKPSLDAINSWNRENRFGRAYLDGVGDAAVEMDVNMAHGVSRENLEATFSVWRLVLGEFVRYIAPN